MAKSPIFNAELFSDLESCQEVKTYILGLLDGSSEKQTKAIKFILRHESTWLVSRLRHKATVEEMETVDTNVIHVGGNIAWDIRRGVSAATDWYTGLGLNPDQMLFPQTVPLRLYDHLGEEWTIYIQGKTKELLQMIYAAYCPLFQDMGEEIWFEGITKCPGGYRLDLDRYCYNQCLKKSVVDPCNLCQNCVRSASYNV
jgi:hypothetical protein